jgi:hypothetical protein
MRRRRCWRGREPGPSPVARHLSSIKRNVTGADFKRGYRVSLLGFTRFANILPLAGRLKSVLAGRLVEVRREKLESNTIDEIERICAEPCLNDFPRQRASHQIR